MESLGLPQKDVQSRNKCRRRIRGQPANPGSPGKMAIKTECVCVCVMWVTGIFHLDDEMLSRLDYGNATLYGLPGNQIDRLQSLMNATARLVLSARKYEHVTPLLRDLHWLQVPERMEFKLAVLVFRCLHGTAPAYLADELRRVTDSDSRRRLLQHPRLRWWFHQPVEWQSTTVPFLLQGHVSATRFHLLSLTRLL